MGDAIEQDPPGGGSRTHPRAADDAGAVVDLFRRVGRALRAADFDAPGQWASSLTMPQLRVLHLLGRNPSLPVGSVAEAMRTSQPSATETIDRLVRAGLVVRTTCTVDRRVVRTSLTDAGRTLIDRPWEARRALLGAALDRATAGQRAAIIDGLSTLCDTLAAVADPVTGISTGASPPPTRPTPSSPERHA